FLLKFVNKYFCQYKLIKSVDHLKQALFFDNKYIQGYTLRHIYYLMKYTLNAMMCLFLNHIVSNIFLFLLICILLFYFYILFITLILFLLYFLLFSIYFSF